MDMKTLTIAVFFVLPTIASSAQFNNDSTATNASVLWANLGGGLGFYNFFAHGGVTYQYHSFLAKARIVVSKEFRVEVAFGGNPGFTRPLESLIEYDLLFGITSTESPIGIRLSLYSGASMVTGTVRGKILSSPGVNSAFEEHEVLDKAVIGLPLEATLEYKPNVYVSFGVSAFANYNSKKNYSTLTFYFLVMTPV